MGVITRHRLIRLAALALLSAAAAVPQTASRIRLERIATGITNCTDIQSARDGSGRLFLMRQAGTVAIWRNGQVLPSDFLDIRGRLTTGGERGLLGMAFPPGFAQKRYFYVNYTNLQGATVVSRFRLASDNAADNNSEQILLTVPQPFSNHNGGQLQFGPDGYLYIGLGDGGSANDPQNHGQNRRSLLGKMLRVDVESDLTRYQVPADNPFAGNAEYAPEIWATGLRNPWRYAFDRETGDLFIADVGQNRFEEISYQPRSSRGGENYGWVTMEGRECFRAGCNTAGLTLPVHVYPRSEGVSITGGYVYRGTSAPSLAGMYIYGDFASGRIWGLRRQGDAWVNELLLSSGLAVSTFGEDEAGEMYVANHRNGEVLRIAGTSTGQRPVFTSANAVNAASFGPGLAAGSLASVFASGLLDVDGTFTASSIPPPIELGGVRVRINGVDAPVLAVVRNGSNEQINFQVPWELPTASATMIITARGLESEPIPVTIARIAPGIFGVNATDALVIRSAGFALVPSGSPLERNATYILYATGLGEVQQRITTGLPLPVSSAIRAPSSMTIGGVPAMLDYVGNAPFFLGLYQVNFRVGNGAPAGPQDLILTVDGIPAPPRRVVVAQ
jgi:uncharacterized protein (TIGR03437 family)